MSTLGLHGLDLVLLRSRVRVKRDRLAFGCRLSHLCPQGHVDSGCRLVVLCVRHVGDDGELLRAGGEDHLAHVARAAFPVERRVMVRQGWEGYGEARLGGCGRWREARLGG